jgi:hypothetical protein
VKLGPNNSFFHQQHLISWRDTFAKLLGQDCLDFAIDIPDTLGYEDFADHHSNRFRHSSFMLWSYLDKQEVGRPDSSIYWTAFQPQRKYWSMSEVPARFTDHCPKVGPWSMTTVFKIAIN